MKKKILLSILMLTVCVMSGVIFTTAWLRRTWAPEFSEDQIQVETSGSLVINLAGDDSHTPVNKITLTELFNLSSTFQLKQVSNCSGLSDDFFKIDYGTGEEGEEKVVHLVNTDTYQNLGLNNGYIDVTFFLSGASQENSVSKYIYLDKSSCIERLDTTTAYDVTSAIRISISVQGRSEPFIIKTGDKTHTGITNETSDGSYIASNQYLYSSIVGGVKTVNSILPKSTTENVYNLSDLDGYNESNPDDFDYTQVLFSMTATEYKQITVRIWLEGFDTNCIDQVSGDKLKIKLIFKSRDVDNASK